MVRGGSPENQARGYKAALSNEHVSDKAKSHAQDELNQLQNEPGRNDEQRHEGNVKRGLKAASHNANNTDFGREEARHRLEEMGEQVEEPTD